ncbi:MAG: lysophospholipid acyltransferase family protein [Notoacmeibacter sp.]
MRWIRGYSRLMVFWMRAIGGIQLEVRGTQPKGASIIAAKHQSWGDGFAMFSQFEDLSFVTGDHLEKMPLVGSILRKMGAVVVASCGGVESRTKLTDKGVSKAKSEGRPVLIYPEGRIVPPGLYYPYKKGVFHMYEAQNCPVVPVATNLGLFWSKDDWNLRPGLAVVEFLEPIAPGLAKDEFMALLHERIETASLKLLPGDFVVPRERVWADPSDPKTASKQTVPA